MAYTRSGRRYKGGRTTRRMGSRRLSRPRYVRPSMTRGKALDELRVYVDPFSIATSNPKIPDGKATSSAGIKLQAVTEFINDGSGVMDFILYPGLNSGLIGFSIANDPLNYQALSYSNHISFEDDGGTGIQVVAGSNKISKWRCVSQGVRFSLINNSDENDGWWEAIRWSPREEVNDFFVAQSSDDAAHRTYAPVNLITGNMVEHPSYTTGKLRDIDKFLFQLKANTDDHEFHRIRDNYDLTNEVEVQEDLIDHSYDFVYLRVHGRPSADGNPPSRIMAHLVSNQELIYDEASFLKRFQTETNPTASFTALKNQLAAQNPKAGKKRKTGD